MMSRRHLAWQPRSSGDESAREWVNDTVSERAEEETQYKCGALTIYP